MPRVIEILLVVYVAGPAAAVVLTFVFLEARREYRRRRYLRALYPTRLAQAAVPSEGTRLHEQEQG